MLALLLACLSSSPPDHTTTPADAGTDSGTIAVVDTAGDTGSVVGGVYEDGRRWSIVRIDAPEPWGVVIVAPVSSTPAPPVLLAAVGGLSSQPNCTDGVPDTELIVDIGAVTMWLLGSGCCAGVCTEATDDQGGPIRQQALRELAAFASGERETEDGLSLSEIAGHPIDTDRQALMLSSAVTLTGLAAIAADPSAFPDLDGVVIYEAPIQPEGITKSLGLLPWDRDATTDSSGSGCTWDDGGSPWYQPGDCDGPSCQLDTSALAWTDSVAASDLSVYPGLSSSVPAAAGMLFLDGDGDGVLSLSPRGHPDMDGDGHISRDEDLPLPGSPDISSGTDRYWQPVALLEAAIDKGLLDETAWPAHLMSPTISRIFWQERDGYSALSTISEAKPELKWIVSASSRDHGIPLCTRPHIVSLYERLRQLGADVSLGPSAEALEQLGAPTSHTFLPPRAPLTEADIAGLLPWPGTSAATIRTASAIDLLFP